MNCTSASSFLVAGNRRLVPVGRCAAITDGCIGWDTTIGVLETLARAVVLRWRTCGPPSVRLHEAMNPAGGEPAGFVGLK
jgi:hypothetical protein